MDSFQIRNFVIISHIDHGKSTLADRLLEVTGTIAANKMRPQFLDMMDLEREKGITIKMKPVRMSYIFDSRSYILNLIDTPGHVDFSYEVSRSLAAVEGAVLLVDASQGIQAQTLANLDLAQKQNLVLIPAVNKIDLPQADVEKTVEEVSSLIRCDPKQVLRISAKQGTNVEALLKEIIQKIPAPLNQDTHKPFRALIFDSEYDAFKGVIAFVRVIDGEIKNGAKIRLMATNTSAEVKEIGYFKPQMEAQQQLSIGEIGYIATGIKEPGLVRVGDTIVQDTVTGNAVAPLAGYLEPRPMVFASLYPEDSDDFDLLRDAIAKLKLSDPALTSEPETKEFLGRGFRCGFLGTLHAEIVSERLQREFGLRLVISTPSVVFKITDPQGKETTIYSASDWPEVGRIQKTAEPWVQLEVVSPISYIGSVSEVLKALRGTYVETKYLSSSERVILVYEVPLRAIITNLYDKIKGVSQGYASMNYRVIGFREGDLVKLEIYLAGEKEEAFSRIVSRDEAYQDGKRIVEKLKATLPPEQFSVALQAVAGGKVLARETLRAVRKDVTGYLYGGDYTRKRKLLEKQKKGKKLLRAQGKVNVPPKVFLEIFRG